MKIVHWDYDLLEKYDRFVRDMNEVEHTRTGTIIHERENDIMCLLSDVMSEIQKSV